MKKCFIHFCSILFLLLFSFQSYATHLAAADMYITYIGKNADGCSEPEYKYEVMLIIYGACENTSGSIGRGHTVRYRSDDAGGVVTNINMVLVDSAHSKRPVPNDLPGGPFYDGAVVHELCPAFDPINSCYVPANLDKYPGFRKWVFRGEVTLPSAQKDWKFYWSDGNRNFGIKNLLNAGGRMLYIEAGINNVAQYNVSTPRFTSNPLPYICVNSETEYLNDPLDIQIRKDTTVKLRASAQIPLAAENTPIPYDNTTPTNFSFENPINSSKGYFVDPLTGTAKFKGTETGFFVLAFRLDKEKKNDDGTYSSIAYTLRDVQVSVLDCQKEPPTIDTVPQVLANATWRPIIVEEGFVDSAIYVCPGSQLSFQVRGHTSTPGNTVYMRSNQHISIPGANITVSGDGTQDPVATFTWTPKPEDAGDYTLIFSANDSTCSVDQPIVLRKPAIFVVRVGPGLNAGEDQKYCLNSGTEKQLYVSGTYNGLLKVRWTNIDGSAPIGMDDPESIAPRVIPPNGVEQLEYKVMTQDLSGNCPVEDVVELNADFSNSITIPITSPYVLCKPEYLQLDAIFKGDAPLTNLPCGTTMADNSLVMTFDSVAGSLALGKNALYDTLGYVTPYFPIATRTAKQQILLTKQDMAAYGVFPGTIRSIIFDVVEAKKPDHEFSNFSIYMKCTPKKELSQDEFERTMTLVYSAKSAIKIPLGLNEFELNYPYNWDSSQNLVIQICYYNNATTEVCDPPIMRFVPTTYISRLLYYPLDATRKPDPAVVDVCGAIATNIQEYYTRPLVMFKYNIAPIAPKLFKWSPGYFLSDSTIQSPLAFVPGTRRFIVESLGSSSCKLFDTLDVYVPANEYNVTPFDTTICYGTEATLQVAGTVGDAHLYKWYEYEDGNYKMATTTDCNTCRDVRVHPLKTTHYKIAVYDSVFCIDTVDAIVKVLPRPDVKLLTRDTVIRYGQSIQLLASGARQYSWLPSGSLSKPNTSAPLATPVEPTSYVVTGIAANGCRTMDTVRVDIDYRDNILVPTAFSPNGDGKNDVFRVANLTFQRIMEFRVFNRWGQEIYSTNDIKGGWDGTWKGEPQPLDNYRYLIRVAFPDGIVETYKGDVTLIR